MSTSTEFPSPSVAFVGNPNCGKSTIFNALTGLRQKVANFPGVTVEPATATLSFSKSLSSTSASSSTYTVVDLPGLYSLSPKTPDEELSVRVVRGEHEHYPQPSALVYVMEATSLEKGLFFYSQIAELGIPLVVVVTMIDTVKANGGVFDDIALEHALGVPVISIVGHKGIGLEELRHALAEQAFQIPTPLVGSNATIEERYAAARTTTLDVVKMTTDDVLTRKIDKVVLHPVWGPMIFVMVMVIFFQAIFAWAEPAKELIEGAIGYLQAWVVQILPDGIVQDFVSKGIIAGVGAVVVFLPQIVLLTLMISVLEDFGYLSRAAFLVDRLMGVFGLQGRSFIPILGSFACAIPGIMSARIIPSEKDRMATIMVAHLMTCSARLPVYVLLISVFVPSTTVLGVMNLQAVVLMGLYFVAGLSGLIIAKIFKSTMFAGSKLPFLMELPPYRFPTWRTQWITLWHRSKSFLTSAGTIILFLSVVLWCLSAFPRVQVPEGMTGVQAEQFQLEHSILGTIGKTIQPVFAPLGFDWKITVGVLSSFAAREVFVAVMAQVYSVDVSGGEDTLKAVLQQSITLPIALSVIAFYVYALQCISTIAIMKRETGSWKYPALAFAYTLVLAYGASWLTFTIAQMFLH